MPRHNYNARAKKKRKNDASWVALKREQEGKPNAHTYQRN
jgi:hypothetical protein